MKSSPGRDVAMILNSKTVSYARPAKIPIHVDPRGIGDSGPLPSATIDYGIIKHLECDWPAVVGWVKSQYPSAPIVLLGHSLGGQLSAI